METYRFSIWSRIYILFLSVLVLNIISCDQIKNLFPGEKQESSVVQTQWVDPEEESIAPPEVLNEAEPSVPKPIIKPVKDNAQYYYIQAGAFKKQINAENYIRDLKKKSLNPRLFTQESDGKTWFTVRLGSHEKNDQAVKAGQDFSNRQNTEVAIIFNNKVKRVIRPVNAGKKKVVSLNPDLKSLVAVKKIKKEAAAKAKAAKFKKAAKQKLYSFQVGGLLSKKNALRQKKKLELKGYNTFVGEVRDKLNNELWSTVQVGYYRTLLEAAKAARQFTYEEHLPTHARHIYDYYKHF